QVLPTRPGPELGDRVGHRAIGEIDPADNAPDERRCGRHREELPRLLDARAGLDEDRRLDPVRREQWLEILRPEPATDRREIVGQPRVLGRGRVPEVVMGVDDHGTGASAEISPSARSSSQRAAGIGARISSGYSSRWSMRRTPAISDTTAG